MPFCISDEEIDKKVGIVMGSDSDLAILRKADAAKVPEKDSALQAELNK